MQKITPFLWFDSQAEEAMNFYVSIFKDSKINRVTRYGEAGPGTPGTVMSAEFTLNGTDFYALNGGSNAKIDEVLAALNLGIRRSVCMGSRRALRFRGRMLEQARGSRVHTAPRLADVERTGGHHSRRDKHR